MKNNVAVSLLETTRKQTVDSKALIVSVPSSVES
jgi:hypothetical protein